MITELFCGDFRKKIAGMPDCCSSCHSDEEYWEENGGSYPMVEIEIRDGNGGLAHVCCAVADHVRNYLGGN